MCFMVWDYEIILAMVFLQRILVGVVQRYVPLDSFYITSFQQSIRMASSGHYSF